MPPHPGRAGGRAASSGRAVALGRATTDGREPPSVDPDSRPEHNHLIFGKDPGEEVPTHGHALRLREAFAQQCDRTARLLRRADALLVGTGAGYSADSKVATYKDVANIPAWRDQGLSYYDLCQPHWLRDDP
mmetsp:Transcript_23388/g.47662  ORF Transcript_23388/g.47662 Transcript_23388/m.47662 type:complete len:132 (-) Transcript_23388:13-408(-)